MGSDVILALSGDTAEELLATQDFDVIVIDLVLEQGSPLAVADIASFRQPDANVIFVTDTTFFSDGSIFSHSGNARAIVPKQTAPQDLANIIDHYGHGVSHDHDLLRSQG